MNRKGARAIPLWDPSERGPSSIAAGAQIGRISAADASGNITVELLPSLRVCKAKLAVALSVRDLQSAIETRQSAVVVFENGDAASPIIVGLIAAPTPADHPNATPAESKAVAPQAIEATVDGSRMRIVAQDEIVFECGAASITLRRNGRVIIRGTHVESYSEGTNRIKGGQVRIN